MKYRVLVAFLFFSEICIAQTADTIYSQLTTNSYCEYYQGNRVKLHWQMKEKAREIWAYDLFFVDGKLDKIHFSIDSCNSPILYWNEKDKRFELEKLETSQKVLITDPNNLYSGEYYSLNECNPLVLFGMKLDENLDLLSQVFQRERTEKVGATLRDNGILISFRKRNPNVCIIHLDTRNQLMVYFKKNGLIHTINILDNELSSNIGLGRYKRYKYKSGRLKSI